MRDLSFRVKRLDASIYRVPLDQPVRTSFGEMWSRPGVLVRMEDIDGHIGWGEAFANWPVWGAESRAAAVNAFFADRIENTAFDTPDGVFDRCTAISRILVNQTAEAGPFFCAAAAIDTAAWDLAARRAGEPLNAVLGGDMRNAVPAYASGINPEGADETVRCAREIHTAFKLKVGFDRLADRRRVERVLSMLMPGERLMIDANQAWSSEEAHEAVAAFSGLDLTWIEEPMPVDEPDEAWRKLAQACSIPIAGGENIFGDAAFDAAIRSGHLAVIQPDLAKWGGISGCRRVAERIKAAGRLYCPHYLGGGIGLIASAHLLAAIGGEGILEFDINWNPIRALFAAPFPKVSEGIFPLPQAPGLGVAPAVDALARYKV